MDAYATVADLVDRFGEREIIALTDTDDNMAVREDRAQRKLDDAHALVDGYIGMAYKLPLAGCVKPAPQPGDPQAVIHVAPPLLVRIVCDVTRYYLYDDHAPDEIKTRYEGALQQLVHISQGRAVLACPWGGVAGEPLGAEPQTGGGEVAFSAAPRQITDAHLGWFA